MAELVHLVRHGEVHNPRHLVYASLPGFYLSTRGVLQTHQARRYLAARPIRAIWSSPLKRAVETAENLAVPHLAEVQVLSELVEWKLLDRWAGHSWEQIPTLFPGEVEAYLQHPSDLGFASETLMELAERVSLAVRKIAASTSSGEVVVVGHQDPIQAARLALTGQPLRQLFQDRPQHCSVITLRPGDCWTEVRKWDPANR
ncbi:MAG: histidine phosphatase family protein [bacterium]|nr:histidine phosphatase family protein [Acidimicrobiia bacterium]MCY4650584.1 histidine phosphatase family protein [bacterium]